MRSVLPETLAGLYNEVKGGEEIAEHLFFTVSMLSTESRYSECTPDGIHEQLTLK